VNIHDLARHLDISIGTVSRALNGRSQVSEKTRKRVLAAAEKLGYTPNQSGRSLRQGATGIVGFLIATTHERAEKGEAAFFMSIFDGLQAYLAERNRDLVVLMSSAEQDPMAFLRRTVERRIVDGMIIAETRRHDPRIDYLVRRKLPFVSFGRSLSAGEYSWLDFDFEGVATRSIERLYRQGHRRIAVATAASDINYGFLFVDACRAALRRHKIELTDDLVLREAPNEAGGSRIGGRLIAMADRPTAVVLVDNKMATGLYHRLYEAGLAPGRDVAIIVLDDGPHTQYLSPPLTCYRVPLREIGRSLGEMLVNAIDGGAPRHVITPMELVAGGSDGFRVSPHRRVAPRNGTPPRRAAAAAKPVRQPRVAPAE